MGRCRETVSFCKPEKPFLPLPSGFSESEEAARRLPWEHSDCQGKVCCGFIRPSCLHSKSYPHCPSGKEQLRLGSLLPRLWQSQQGNLPAEGAGWNLQAVCSGGGSSCTWCSSLNSQQNHICSSDCVANHHIQMYYQAAVEGRPGFPPELCGSDPRS